jgi:hypothetical protein
MPSFLAGYIAGAASVIGAIVLAGGIWYLITRSGEGLGD